MPDSNRQNLTPAERLPAHGYGRGSAFWRVVRVIAWLSLLLIAVATLGPLSLRPTTGLPPQIERFAAFLVVGVLFAAAYPRRILLVGVVVLSSAVVLEILQLIEPFRHGRLLDACFKLAGGALGLAIGWLTARRLNGRGGLSASDQVGRSTS
jgi:hypothetical protein